jgi:hypothetical protein
MGQIQRSMTHLYCGVPVTDRAVAVEWFEAFFGRQPVARRGAHPVTAKIKG